MCVICVVVWWLSVVVLSLMVFLGVMCWLLMVWFVIWWFIFVLNVEVVVFGGVCVLVGIMVFF